MAKKKKENQALPGIQETLKQKAPISQQATPDLIKELKDKDSNVRQNAVQTIGAMRDEKAVEFIIAVMKDDNRFVRQEAVGRTE